MHKENAVAFKPRNLNSQKLLSIFCIPDSDLVQGSSGENIRKTMWEYNIVDSFIMASISKLRRQGG
jgi:hypothetical protein